VDNPLPIRFCVNNPRSLSSRNKLIAMGIECRDCLSNCTICFEKQFLEIEGEIAIGDTYERILEEYDKKQG
jgi:uncharacterized protein YuzB (UPF0349 family)